MTHFDLALPKSQSYIYNPCIVVHRLHCSYYGLNAHYNHGDCIKSRCATHPMFHLSHGICFVDRRMATCVDLPLFMIPADIGSS